MNRGSLHIGLLTVILVGLLLNFQNCAPAKNSPSDSSTTGQLMTASSDLNTIDQVQLGKIQFVQSKTTLNGTDTTLRADGLCSQDQNGATLSWVLIDSQQQVLFSGNTLCQNGIFSVAFDGAQQLACGAKMTLQAHFGAKAETEIQIEKICN